MVEPSQLCSSAEVVSSSTVPITGPHSVPMPPTIDTSAASIEMLKLKAVAGIDEVDVLGVEGAGECGEKCADHVDVALDPRRVDADRLRRVFVLADGDEVIAHPGLLDPAR